MWEVRSVARAWWRGSASEVGAYGLMDLIDTNIKPDPFNPQRGDVYESQGPFPQRIVVEDPPTAEDPRIRYRVDGGVDSNLTTLGQFHLHLAGLGEGKCATQRFYALDSALALRLRRRSERGRSTALWQSERPTLG